VEAKKVKIKLEDPADVRLSNIVEMGLTFSTSALGPIAML
jgi:hypothetical protein